MVQRRPICHRILEFSRLRTPVGRRFDDSGDPFLDLVAVGIVPACIVAVPAPIVVHRVERILTIQPVETIGEASVGFDDLKNCRFDNRDLGVPRS